MIYHNASFEILKCLKTGNTKCDEAAEQLWNIADGNAKWYTHFGKQFSEL